MSRTDTLARLRAADPVAACGLPAHDAEATLARILACPYDEPGDQTDGAPAPHPRPTGRRRIPRRIGYLAVPVVAVAAATALAVTLLPGGIARPADARAVASLEAAAHAAETAADAPLRPGQYIYLRTHGMHMESAFLADGQSAVSFRPETTEYWFRTDGAEVRRSVQTGPLWYPTTRDRKLSEASGSRDHFGPSLMRLGPRTPSVGYPTWDFARALPTDPEVLEARIRTETAGQSESAEVAVWETVSAALSNPVFPPALRAALFRIAAGLPGVEYLGEVRDRLGRPGVAVTLAHGDEAHAHEQQVMIFDARTGALLQRERRAPGPAEMGLPASMRDPVTSLTVIEQSAAVDGEGIRPDGPRVDVSKAPLMPGGN
jgi:hypothetical protein